MKNLKIENRSAPHMSGAASKTAGRWSWLFGTLLMLLVVDAGCSQPRKEVEEVDWGQPTASGPRRAPWHEPRSEPTAGGDAAGATGTKQDTGGGESNSGGGGQEGEPGSDTRPAGGESEAPGAGGPGGDSDIPPPAEPERPAPVLPGREPVKPVLSAAEAAESAKQLLKRSQQLLRAANASAAAEAAIEAYDQVLPHAERDKDCRKLCKQIEDVLTATGRGQGRPEAVPTRFE